ncbi:MAG: NAD-dependent epimerase/dehydratase family protein [Myxococcales bacterium]|nr:MAG: NAD-dependent epimerase/dehydratase family protein [Myxococcales bacterium]
MARITVLGGTGYAGAHLVSLAAQRGHDVTSYSRSEPATPVAGVDYRTGDVTDDAVLAAAVQGADVVVSAIAPRGEIAAEGVVRDRLAKLADVAQAQGVRLGVIGGAGSLLVAEGGPKLIDTEGFPEEFKPEAREMGAVLDQLRASDEQLDWFFVSPAAMFGSFNPGEARGTYRVGGDILLADENGNSDISGADFAAALVSEIEEPQHRRARFTAAY